MKVVLLKDIEKVGFSGDIIKVKDGYAQNFLFPKKLAVEITAANEQFYLKQVKAIEDRKVALESTSTMLAEKIKALALTIKKPGHDGDKLYAAINGGDIVEMLGKEGISIGKSQVIFNKSIKQSGNHEVTIKLSSKLQPSFKLKVMIIKAAQ